MSNSMDYYLLSRGINSTRFDNPRGTTRLKRQILRANHAANATRPTARKRSQATTTPHFLNRMEKKSALSSSQRKGARPAIRTCVSLPVERTSTQRPFPTNCATIFAESLVVFTATTSEGVQEPMVLRSLDKLAWTVRR